jgi:hypothetical protein
MQQLGFDFLFSKHLNDVFIVVMWLEVICVFWFKPLLFNSLTNAKNSFVYFLQWLHFSHYL